MKIKLLTDTIILTLMLLATNIFLEFYTQDGKPNSIVSISVDSLNLESNKEKVETDLSSLNGVTSAEVSIEVGVLEILIDNNNFDATSVKKTLDKWGISNDDEWEIEVIASSDF